MEAQYALQKKKPLIPLMLVQGYEADGWLGLLLGTSMWYGFYGDALSSESGFEGRMDALSREIGMRGRADVTLTAAAELDATPLHQEFMKLRPTQLKQRARESGVDAAAIDATDDADVPKEALIALLLALSEDSRNVEEEEEEEVARVALAGMRVTELKRRARAAGVPEAAIDEADDAPSPKEALVALLLSPPKGARAAPTAS
jgi:hypothetical protein